MYAKDWLASQPMSESCRAGLPRLVRHPRHSPGRAATETARPPRMSAEKPERKAMKSFSLPQILLHWIVALLVLLQFLNDDAVGRALRALRRDGTPPGFLAS